MVSAREVVAVGISPAEAVYMTLPVKVKGSFSTAAEVLRK